MSFSDNQILMYETVDGVTKIEVKMEDETVWLNQSQMAELFQTTKQNISLHINNCFKEGELGKNSVVKEYLTTASDGKEYKTQYYNLDVIISVGYRVKSLRGTQFRIWANSVLKEYLKKGFAMNDDLLKRSGGGNYFKELLERIRDIRSSEKVFYRQVDEKSNVHYLHVANSVPLVTFYNLDVIISVSYRMQTLRGTQFRT